MATHVINITYQLKRGSKEALNRVNPLLAEGEPCVELDTGKFKIGNGVDYWNDLNYVGEQNVINAKTRFEFPNIGEANTLYKAEEEGMLYQWNTTLNRYESLNNSDITIEDIQIISGGCALDIIQRLV